MIQKQFQEAQSINIRVLMFLKHVKMRSPNQGLGSIPASKKWCFGSDPRVHYIPELHFMNSGINPRTLNSFLWDLMIKTLPYFGLGWVKAS